MRDSDKEIEGSYRVVETTTEPVGPEPQQPLAPQRGSHQLVVSESATERRVVAEGTPSVLARLRNRLFPKRGSRIEPIVEPDHSE